MLRVSCVYEVPQKHVCESCPPGPFAGKWTTPRFELLAAGSVPAAATPPTAASVPAAATVAPIHLDFLMPSFSFEAFDPAALTHSRPLLIESSINSY
jgi:hypothetical protein